MNFKFKFKNYNRLDPKLFQNFYIEKIVFLKIFYIKII